MFERPDCEGLARAAFRSRWEASLLAGELRVAEERARTHQARLASLEGSLSWRMSRPFRALEGILRGAAGKFGPPRSKANAFDWADNCPLSAGGDIIAVDVSRTWRGETSPGMRRVVRGFVESLPLGLPVRPVDIRRGAIHDLSGYWEIPEKTSLPELRKISRLFLMDASWDAIDSVSGLSRVCSDRGIQVIGCLHDLIPLEFPETCSPEVPRKFEKWLEMAIQHFDCMVCVSESTARALEERLSNVKPAQKRLSRIGWWIPGSPIKEEPVSERSPAPIPAGPYALMVGTLEPRKNHAFVLEEFSNWWAGGEFDGALVFLGAKGWGMDGFVERLTEHPEFGKRLWWLPDATESELRSLYRACRLVLMPSIAEGLGLPLIEAAAYGKPAVLSDIAIFREIVTFGGAFFSPGDREGFRLAFEEAWSPEASALQTLSPSPAAAAQNLFQMIKEETWQLRV